ncbi:hypothetical protein FKM82_002265 [Ascaphus truei]
MIALFCFSLISFGFSMFAGVHGWSYYHSSVNMTYEEARRYCKTHYTDIVAIQNKEENEHLNKILPFNPTYYWIGIRKIDNQWTWVGTNKVLTEEAKNWATSEPNNKKNDEDCVEMYVKRIKDEGKWNDESCKKNKVALCYTAACNSSSCSGHGECIETINSYTCKCHAGFKGSECEEVMVCKPLEKLEKGSFHCSSPNGNFSYGASCQFWCEEGYDVDSESTVECTASGWTSPAPQCEVVECIALESPDHGHISCDGPFGEFMYNSSCEFSCEEGFDLRGNKGLQCMTNSEWSGVGPRCEVVKCPAINRIEHGSVTCSHVNGDFAYNSACDFTCKEGFVLVGSEGLQCTAQGAWTNQAPYCEVIHCERPVEPVNGAMSCSDSKDNLPEKSTCDFSCAEGFTLVGSPSLLCVAPGQWTENTPKCEVVKCPAINRIEHGSVTCSHVNGDFAYNSACDFTCKEGFVLVGSEGLQCTAQGAWTNQAPYCEAVACPPVTAPEHASMDCKDEFGIFQYNSNCSFNCNEGFLLTGSQSLQCSTSGTWSSEVPACQAVECVSLKAPENGQVGCQGASYYNSKCSFTCAEGYSLIGSSDLQCLSSGEWTTSAPTCEGSCYTLYV